MNSLVHIYMKDGKIVGLISFESNNQNFRDAVGEWQGELLVNAAWFHKHEDAISFYETLKKSIILLIFPRQ